MVPTTQVSPETGEQIKWQVISSGATDASSANYHMFGTAGQPAVGAASSANYGLSHGYWQEFVPAGGGCCGQYTSGMTGNADCDDQGKRNLADITRLIDRVYISKVELCCEENGNVDGDLDGKLNLADITSLIDHVYISKQETAACE